MTFTIQQIASIAHETNAAYCRSIGDNSQLPWEQAPNWQRESAVKGVLFHLQAHASGSRPSPSASHESWLHEKRSAGWMYGPLKNADKREHPCFVPYDELPIEQRMKDYLFASVVAAFVEAGAEIQQAEGI